VRAHGLHQGRRLARQGTSGLGQALCVSVHSMHRQCMVTERSSQPQSHSMHLFKCVPPVPKCGGRAAQKGAWGDSGSCLSTMVHSTASVSGSRPAGSTRPRQNPTHTGRIVNKIALCNNAHLLVAPKHCWIEPPPQGSTLTPQPSTAGTAVPSNLKLPHLAAC
jgi:hypothetical protein